MAGVYSEEEGDGKVELGELGGYLGVSCEWGGVEGLIGRGEGEGHHAER
jgi:hypothetical protein